LEIYQKELTLFLTVYFRIAVGNINPTIQFYIILPLTSRFLKSPINFAFSDSSILRIYQLSHAFIHVLLTPLSMTVLL